MEPKTNYKRTLNPFGLIISLVFMAIILFGVVFLMLALYGSTHKVSNYFGDDGVQNTLKSATDDFNVFRYIDAIVKLDEVINKENIKPEDISYAYDLRGRAKDFSSDYVGAKSDYLQAIAIFPDDNKIIYYSMGRLYYRDNDFENALKYYELALVSDPEDKLSRIRNEGILWDEVEIYNIKVDYVKLNEVFSKIIELNPKNSLAYRSRAFFVYGNLGEKEKALADYVKTLDLNPNDQFARLEKASLELDLNRKQKGCEDLKLIDVKQIKEYLSWYEELAKECELNYQ
jgi:tetratricopeptide (TPR) repeat protein